ncbi:MAG: SRPBCC family protein [Rhodanobacter sp.]
MNRIRTLAIAALVLIPGVTLAAAPTLKVSKSVTIHAPAAAVWAKAKDFNALNTWHPAVAKDEIIAGTNNIPGAERRLTLGNGGEIHEKLVTFNNAHRMFTYVIVDGVLPVSHYRSTFKVIAMGKDSSKVTWSGSFKRKDTGAHPAADADDKTAITAIGGVYQSGLDNLKKILETK